MRKRAYSERGLFFTLVFAVVFMVFVGVIQVMAADIMIDGKVTSVTQKVSKTGNPYTILVIPVNRDLNGVKYTTEISVFCFKDVEAKKLKAGDSVKMIAKHTTDKIGNEFTTLVAFVK